MIISVMEEGSENQHLHDLGFSGLGNLARNNSGPYESLSHDHSLAPNNLSETRR